jgi:DNA-binding PadR family transcriptional regulator
MTKSRHDDLLARLAGKVNPSDDDSPFDILAATDPEHCMSPAVSRDGHTQEHSALDGLLEQISHLTSDASSEPDRSFGGAVTDASPNIPHSTQHPVCSGTPAAIPARTADRSLSQPDNTFVPREPTSFQEALLTESEVEQLILKYLLARGEDSGHGVADQIRLPFILIEDLLRRLKQDQYVIYRGTTSVNDYVFQLTDLGRERARRHSRDCTYFGAVPVALEHYIESVKLQSLHHQNPSDDDLRRAFEDLLINHKMFDRLGPAINSGRGMFLFGYPGNGKTSIAERITKCFGQYIWVPRSIGVDGEIIRLYDPSHHELAPQQASTGLMQEARFDRRWVRVRRPTIIVGGELTMDNLELSINRTTGINEAPVQLKSNCGTLVIDDFGRQRMSTDELLNRWIVPLEKRYDFLNLPSGKKIQVPFDQLIVFSTNLEPRDLVDDAFLRRIPYKIEVINPTEDEFRKLFQLMCPGLGFEYCSRSVDHLIETHYKAADRPFRCCHPRDLLLQVQNHCYFKRQPMVLSPEKLDFAVENYFAAM